MELDRYLSAVTRRLRPLPLASRYIWKLQSTYARAYKNGVDPSIVMTDYDGDLKFAYLLKLRGSQPYARTCQGRVRRHVR
jgi:hypothetical protein